MSELISGKEALIALADGKDGAIRYAHNKLNYFHAMALMEDYEALRKAIELVESVK